ncbi:MAG TPA: PAS domain S-box protein [Pirellulales bacterium]|nr:PAS domain S-box protein [Pirellulales bacterium]
MLDFFEFSNEMLAVTDDRGYAIRVNSAWTKTLGWSVEELLSRPYIELLHPDDAAAAMREAELLFSGTHETVSFENRWRAKDGSYRWLAWYAKLDPDSKQLVGAARDITEQKLKAAALQESEERFAAFMDHSSAIAWAKDEQGRLVYFNKAYESRFQMKREDWLGKTDFDLWPPEIAQQFRENDRKVLAGGVPISVTEESRRGGSALAYWMVAKFPYRDRHGNHYVGGIGVDITEIKQFEAQSTSQRQLLRDLIEVQEKEKQFLCHEFHDGLIQYAVGSLMLLETCKQLPLPAAGSAMIDEAIKNLRRGIEDGRRVIQGIRPALLDEGSLRDAVQELVHQFSTNGMKVECGCDPAIGQLPETIQTTAYRVVQEALNNARKHSGTDLVTVAVRRQGGDLRIEIRDFGRGFDVASARQRGFGLRGMSERAQLSGGECLIQSDPGAGTSIFVRLPIPPANEDE